MRRRLIRRGLMLAAMVLGPVTPPVGTAVDPAALAGAVDWWFVNKALPRWVALSGDPLEGHPGPVPVPANPDVALANAGPWLLVLGRRRLLIYHYLLGYFMNIPGGRQDTPSHEQGRAQDRA